MSQHWEEVIQNPVLVCVALGVTATCKGHSPHPGSRCASGNVKQNGHVCPKEWQTLPWCSPRCGFTGRGDVNEVPVLSPWHCPLRHTLAVMEGTVLSPFLKGDGVWPNVRYQCSEDDPFWPRVLEL